MAKAFLSHSSHDKTFVEKIYLRLGRNRCHYDALTFESGQKTLDEILLALDDTDVFVFFISNAALDSPWVRKELSEAHRRLKDDRIRKIFPLLIDDTITYEDERIPEWMRKSYNLRRVVNQVVAFQKIQQALREAELSGLKQLAEMEDLFVGRNDEMAQFERELIRLDGAKPACIFVTGVFDGIGRRKLLKNGLLKTRVIRKNDSPFVIPMNSKESIENLILALNQLDPRESVLKMDLSTVSIEEKTETAIGLIEAFTQNGIVVNILDDGSIILPNNLIADWFGRIIEDKRFEKQVSVCVIARFRPAPRTLEGKKHVKHFNVPQLNRDDTQSLFLQYAALQGLRVPEEDSRFFLSHLSGIPAQIIYCVDLIRRQGIPGAKSQIGDIDDFAELRVLSVLSTFASDDFCIQVLVLLSRFDIFSFDLLGKIIPDEKKLNEAINKLIMSSVLELLGSSKEMVRLNSSVADYVRRSRMPLSPDLEESLYRVIREILAKDLDITLGTDFTEFLMAIQELINQNKPVPKKYMIPSFVLRMLVQKYNQGYYDDVVTLADQVLENQQRYDQEVVREVRYWTCLSYARTKNPKFYDIVRFFEGDFKDYNFLMGFNHRNLREFGRAEESYKKVLTRDRNHSRSKRELVIVYLKQNRYPDALELAKENYERFRTNPFHIHAYFTCLVKKGPLGSSERSVLESLMHSIRRSLDVRAKDFSRVMEAEHVFYAEGQIAKGIAMMQDAVKLCVNKFHPKRALREMYLRQGMTEPAASLSTDKDYLADSELDQA